MTRRTQQILIDVYVYVHERILLCFKTNDIPRLHWIVNVCLNRMNDAVDKDLALLVLKFSGPALLEILYKSKGLLGISTSDRFINSKNFPLESYEHPCQDNHENYFTILQMILFQSRWIPLMATHMSDGTQKIIFMDFVGNMLIHLAHHLILSNRLTISQN